MNKFKSKILEAINFKPSFYNYKQGKRIYYETSFFCNINKIIHGNLKSYLKCPLCIPKYDKYVYDLYLLILNSKLIKSLK